MSVSNDLVYNCLVDTARIDQIALMTSKEESEQALLVQQRDGRSAIRGGNIKEVHFLPEGDFWQVVNGAVSMIANRKRLRQIIGVDRTTSIRETEHEKNQVQNEVNEYKTKLQNIKRDEHRYKVEWNNLKREDEIARLEMQKHEETIERVQEEAAAAENITVDTTEYENDVQEAQKGLDELKEKEEEIANNIETLKAPIRELEAKVEETRARSEKVSKDLNNAEEKVTEYMKTVQHHQRNLEKRRHKLQQYEATRKKQCDLIQERTEKAEEAKNKARQVTFQTRQTQEKRRQKHSAENDDEDPELQNETIEENYQSELEAIEPIETNKQPQYYRTKIQRIEQEIEKERRRRQITEVDPEVALSKYQRAKKDLEEKMEQVVTIEENEKHLIKDLTDRRNRWKNFRGEYCEVTFSSCL